MIEFFIGNFKKKFDLYIIFIGKPNLYLIWLKKKIERPNRKFFNSIKILPPWQLVYHNSNFPFPLPILVPIGFFDKGKWGKMKSQYFRNVLSDFRELFFKKSFNLKIFLDVNWSGFSNSSPVVPNFKILFVLNFLQIRFFWFFFDLKNFGCNNKKSHKIKIK